jgi:peptide-methionine (S)-S-oxide reductase
MSRLLLLSSLLALALTACQSGGEHAGEQTKPGDDVAAPASQPAQKADATQLAPAPQAGEAIATFAGGCFWCMEGPFEHVEGVRAVLSGYTGGTVQSPSYKQVGMGSTGHTEAVIVYYDPAKVSYDKLVDTFWRSMDPTDPDGQFADQGSQYRPVIFFHTPEQKQIAETSKAALQASGRFDKPIVVPIEPASDFWVAEDYHQDFYLTNPDHYNRYKVGSGRAGFLKEKWAE